MQTFIKTTKGLIGFPTGGNEYDEAKRDKRWPGPTSSKAYIVYLIGVALFGWALASYDFNVYVLTISNISKALHFSSTQVGLIGFFLFAGELVGSFIFGMAMDTRGRRFAWLTALAGATIFTGLTYVIQNYWEAAVIRSLADLFAYSELAISVTIVNEELPAKQRGFLYSIVQAGWPLGVLWAAIAYTQAQPQWGWRILYLFDVPALFIVALLRIWIKEPLRFLHIKEIRKACEEGDDEKVKQLKEDYDIDTGAINKTSIAQLFTSSGENRKQFIFLALTWFFYGASYTATNAYMVYWFHKEEHYSLMSIGYMLLATSAFSFVLYMVTGWLGQRLPRIYMLMVAGGSVAPLTVGLLFVHDQFWVYFLYWWIYQSTNSFWSGIAYAYNAESFPTRFRGIASGSLDAAQIIGLLVGAGIWTSLIHQSAYMTWLIVASGLSLGMYFIFFCRKIPAGQEMEAISR